MIDFSGEKPDADFYVIAFSFISAKIKGRNIQSILCYWKATCFEERNKVASDMNIQAT